MDNLKGSCLCGEISYRLDSKILNVVNCHCDFCRSHSGAAFSTYAALPHASLQITRGEESLASFEAGEGKKHFCRICGTPIFNLNKKYPGACMIYLGTLQGAKDIRPRVNVWCENQWEWVGSLSSIRSLPQGIETRRG